MKVLVIGGGGREHALVWAFKKSPLVTEIYCAPGNAGTEGVATNIDIKADDIPALLEFAKNERIDLTVVGPEDPLVNGIVDEFQRAGLRILGPSKKAARLEGSKVYTKRLLEKYGILTAAFKVFKSSERAMDYAEKQEYPLVVKADGLAAGKGVVVCHTVNEALKAINDIMVIKKYGDAGNSIVIEECLIGEEASYIVLVDKFASYVSLASSQDHKPRDDGDKGPNTGGMGAYSPAPVVTEYVEKLITKNIVEPLIKAMKDNNTPFTGVLYVGLMIVNNNPYVLEINVRFGDPEAQPIFMRLNTDFAILIEDAIDGKLDKMELVWDDRPAVCVVMASKGYPDPYEKGHEITNIEEAEKNGTVVFHAGTKMNDDKLVTSGGRVLGVTALGTDITDAMKNAYNAVGRINCDNLFCRNDIAEKAIDRKKTVKMR